MSYFDKEKRFDELFNNWFDHQFRPYLADNAKHSGLYCLMDGGYSRGRADAYEAIDAWIDQSIESIRRQVNWEFEDWKREQKLLEQEEQ